MLPSFSPKSPRCSSSLKFADICAQYERVVSVCTVTTGNATSMKVEFSSALLEFVFHCWCLGTFRGEVVGGRPIFVFSSVLSHKYCSIRRIWGWSTRPWCLVFPVVSFGMFEETQKLIWWCFPGFVTPKYWRWPYHCDNKLIVVFEGCLPVSKMCMGGQEQWEAIESSLYFFSKR